MKLFLLSALSFAALSVVSVSAQTTVSLGLRLGGNFATRSGADPKYDLYSFTNPTVTQNVTLDYTRTGLLAPQFGAVLDIRFGKLAVQPAVLFSQKGVEQKVDVKVVASMGNPAYTAAAYTENKHFISRPNYLEIPINLVYTSGGDHGVQVFGGPYIAFGMGGQVELEGEYSNLSNGGSSGGNIVSTSYEYGRSFIYYRNEYPGAADPRLSRRTSFEATSGALVARRFDAGVNLGIGYRRGPLQVQLAYGLGLINQQPDKGRSLTDELPDYYQRVTQLTATYFLPLHVASTPLPLP